MFKNKNIIHTIIWGIMPVLTTWWLVLNFINVNILELNNNDIKNIYFLTVEYNIFIISLYVIFMIIRFKAEEAGLFLCIFSIFIFNYNNIKNLCGCYFSFFPYFYISLSIFVVIMAIILLKKVSKKFIGLMGIILFFAFSQSVYLYVNRYKPAHSQNSISEVSEINYKKNSQLPNVYFVLLDAYVRDDILQEKYNFNNELFISDLKQLGFFVTKNTYSNYDNTRLTFESMLNMDYIIHNNGKTNEKPLTSCTSGRFSKAFNELKKLGYKLILATEGGPMSIGDDGDSFTVPFRNAQDLKKNAHSYHLRPKEVGIFSQAELSFLALTPLLDIFRHSDLGVIGLYSEIEDIEKFLDIPGKKDPYIVFAHILLPHLPGRYDAMCQPKKGKWLINSTTFKYNNLNDVRQDYIGNLQCVNKQVLSLFKKIIHTDPNSIIILTADHGIELPIYIGNSSDIGQPYVIDMKYGILSAYRLPNGVYDSQWYDGMSPINYFRWLLGKLGNKNFPLLKDRMFLGKGEGIGISEIENPKLKKR